MEIPDKVLYTLAGVIVLVTLSVRAQSAYSQEEPVEEPAVEVASTSRLVPRQASPVVTFQGPDDPEPIEISGSPSTQRVRIPHTTIGRSEPAEPVSVEDESYEDETVSDEEFEDVVDDEDYVEIEFFPEEPVPDPDVNVWGSSDQQTFNEIISVMSDEEAAAFRSLWLTATPEERQQLLLQARLGMLGG